MKKVLFFDVETTGLPEKGAKWDVNPEKFPKIVQFSWSYMGVMHDYIIMPQHYEIPKESTDIHGITTEKAMKEGVLFQTVLDKFLSMALQAELIVAHNIYFDTSVIKANTAMLEMPFLSMLLNDGLSKAKRICTMQKTIKFVNAKHPDGRGGKYPKLTELYEKLFNGEKFNAHNSKDDVYALEKCYNKLIELKVL